MTTFYVKDADDEEPFLTMVAKDRDSVPDSIEGEEQFKNYARDLADGLGASVAAIASRMGSYSRLVTGDEETSKSDPDDDDGDTLVSLLEFARGRARDEVQVSGQITKTDPAKRLVFGWAYVTARPDGSVAVDKSGDFVDSADLSQFEDSAYHYVLHSRAGDADHSNVQGSTMVESMVFTPEKVEKMGLPSGVLPTGWWVGFKIADDETWGRVERGELTSFSLHGKGTRAKVDE